LEEETREFDAAMYATQVGRLLVAIACGLTLALSHTIEQVSMTGDSKTVSFEFEDIYDLTKNLPTFCESSMVSAAGCRSIELEGRKMLSALPIEVPVALTLVTPKRNQLDHTVTMWKTDDVDTETEKFCKSHKIAERGCIALKHTVQQKYDATYAAIGDEASEDKESAKHSQTEHIEEM
jgi:hypothetical protein